MQLLSLGQTTHIVEARIEGKTVALIALHAASWLSLPLQYQHLLPLACQQRTAYQAAKSTAYDHYIKHIRYLTIYDLSPELRLQRNLHRAGWRT